VVVAASASASVLAGCGPWGAPGVPWPRTAARREGGRWHRPAPRSCPSGSPRAEPRSVPPPGKRCGKHRLLEQLHRGFLRFNQSLVIWRGLSCCCDPVPPPRAEDQASPGPSTTRQVSFPFPQQTVPLLHAMIHHGKARDPPALPSPALLQNSFPSRPSPQLQHRVKLISACLLMV